ncbi:TniB family NTP-binding protein [Primorskyibacter sp. S87]|uniref:TniB family NTP-binding protein n=1 Tax=Primorskyibacter sp. S87 TaxID=3415126 RepID=UPI003C79A8C4
MTDALLVALEQTIHHPSYEEASNRLTEAVSIARSIQGSAIFLSGPTRCGKSQLLRDTQAKLGQPPELSNDLLALSGLEGASDFVIGSIPTKPNSKTLITAMLEAVGVKAGPSQSAHDLQARLCFAVRDKGIRVIALDECSHCAERGAHLSKRGATDHFKWLIDQTGITLILAGLPKFQSLIDENEQLRDRTLSTIELNPYSWSSGSDATGFATALSEALCNLQAAGAHLDFGFEDMVVRLYGVTGGRIGMMVRVLQVAVLKMKSQTLTFKDISDGALTLTQKSLNARHLFETEVPQKIDLVRAYIRVMQDAGLEVTPESLADLEALEAA